MKFLLVRQTDRHGHMHTQKTHTLKLAILIHPSYTQKQTHRHTGRHTDRHTLTLTTLTHPSYTITDTRYWSVGNQQSPFVRSIMYTHARTHTFNGHFSGTTRVGRYQKGKTNLDFTEARDSEWQWHRLGYVRVCTSLQTDNHASTPPLCFLQAGCPSCRPTNSVKALKALRTQKEDLSSAGRLVSSWTASPGFKVRRYENTPVVSYSRQSSALIVPIGVIKFWCGYLSGAGADCLRMEFL